MAMEMLMLMADGDGNGDGARHPCGEARCHGARARDEKTIPGNTYEILNTIVIHIRSAIPYKTEDR